MINENRSHNKYSELGIGRRDRDRNEVGVAVRGNRTYLPRIWFSLVEVEVEGAR